MPVITVKVLYLEYSSYPTTLTTTVNPTELDGKKKLIQAVPGVLGFTPPCSALQRVSLSIVLVELIVSATIVK